jgi:hypothetical protein
VPQSIVFLFEKFSEILSVIDMANLSGDLLFCSVIDIERRQPCHLQHPGFSILMTAHYGQRHYASEIFFLCTHWNLEYSLGLTEPIHDEMKLNPELSG